jgi:DNA-binding transcriptional regulator YiaG
MTDPGKTKRRQSEVNPSRHEQFGEDLVQWRSKYSCKRAEAAEKLDVSPRTVQEWEQGRRVPSQMPEAGVFARIREIDEKGNHQ